MAWIKKIGIDEAKGSLKRLYSQIAGDRNEVANILQIHSLLPDTLRAHLLMYQSVVLKESVISRRQREMIAVFVSNLNNCEY